MAEEQIQPEVTPETWALVEIMGHRTRAGRISEVVIAGAKFLRVDIPTDDGQFITEYYGGSSIYAIRPGTEEIIRANRPAMRIPSRPLAFKEPPPQLPSRADVDSMDDDGQAGDTFDGGTRDDGYGHEDDEYGER